MFAEAAEADIGPVPNYTPIDRSTWESVRDRLPNSCFQKNRAKVCRLFKQQVQVDE